MERINHWIGGKVVPGSSGRTGPVFNPATGEQTHEVDLASPEEVGSAVDAATDAFPAWRSTSLSKRADILFRIRELLEQRKPELARIVTSQHGKVLSDAAGEVQRGLENVEFACGIPNLLKGGFSEQVATGVDVYSIMCTDRRVCSSSRGARSSRPAGRTRPRRRSIWDSHGRDDGGANDGS